MEISLCLKGSGGADEWMLEEDMRLKVQTPPPHDAVERGDIS